MRVQIKKLKENATTPTQGTRFSAGRDFYSAEDVIVPAGKWKLIKTGIALAWEDQSYYPQVMSRSGLNLKFGIFATAGVIDYDYRNEIGVILTNVSGEDYQVRIGDRIAQMIFYKIENEIQFEETSEFDEIDSERNGGGYGSTGR